MTCGSTLLVVEEYVYLGQIIRLVQLRERAPSRVQLGWRAYGKLRKIFSSKLPQCIRTKLLYFCVLSVIIYEKSTKPLTIRAS